MRCDGHAARVLFGDAQDGWRRVVCAGSRAAARGVSRRHVSDPGSRSRPLGDGLQDIVLVPMATSNTGPTSVRQLGAARPHVEQSALPVGSTRGASCRRHHGDGLADIVYVDDRKTLLGSIRAETPGAIRSKFRDTAGVRFSSDQVVDLLGSGIAGGYDAGCAASADDHYFFLDLTGGVKPYLLTEMRNNLGAVTKWANTPSGVLPSRRRRRDTLADATAVSRAGGRAAGSDRRDLAWQVTTNTANHGYGTAWSASFGVRHGRAIRFRVVRRYSQPGLHGDLPSPTSIASTFTPTVTKTGLPGASRRRRDNWQEMDGAPNSGAAIVRC